MLTIIEEKDYKPKSNDKIFNYKSLWLLFKQGFHNANLGLPNLLFRFILWILLVFAVIILVMPFFRHFTEVFNAPIGELRLTEAEQGEAKKTMIELLIIGVLLLSFSFSFLYHSSQQYTVENLMRIEKFSPIFVTFSDKVKDKLNRMACWVFTSIIWALSIILAGGLFIQLNINSFNALILDLTNLSEPLGVLIAFLKILSAFLLVGFVYFLSLANVLVYISNYFQPKKQFVVKRIYKAFKKLLKMPHEIMSLMIVHGLLFSIVIFVLAFIGSLFPVEFAQYFILPVVLIIYNILNRAKIRSLTLLFIMTEDLDTYKDRMTYPILKK